jgi:hypothetical protein
MVCEASPPPHVGHDLDLMPTHQPCAAAVKYERNLLGSAQLLHACGGEPEDLGGLSCAHPVRESVAPMGSWSVTGLRDTLHDVEVVLDLTKNELRLPRQHAEDVGSLGKRHCGHVRTRSHFVFASLTMACAISRSLTLECEEALTRKANARSSLRS